MARGHLLHWDALDDLETLLENEIPQETKRRLGFTEQCNWWEIAGRCIMGFVQVENRNLQFMIYSAMCPSHTYDFDLEVNKEKSQVL